MTTPVASPPRLGPPDPVRVKEIASYLDRVPRGLGFTLDNRATWENLGESVLFENVILPRAEKQLNQPIPEVSEAAYDQAVRTGSREWTPLLTCGVRVCAVSCWPKASKTKVAFTGHRKGACGDLLREKLDPPSSRCIRC